MVVVVALVESVPPVDEWQAVASPKTEPGAEAFAPFFSFLHQQDRLGSCQVKYLCPRELHCGREWKNSKKVYQHLFSSDFT